MPASSETGRDAQGEELMIHGIGGVFLFSNDPKRLAAWYHDASG
jgi:hypothetical protein